VLHLSPEVETLSLSADLRKFKQIVFNLLSNAAKFSMDGGVIIIQARQLEGDSSPYPAWLEVSVSDTGIGIARDDLPHVFENFYQVKNPQSGKTPGTGLGLSLVKSMVELHGGKAWAESDGSGLGSRFVFTLPIHVEDLESTASLPMIR
jgi:signal transduction histidine kinase